MKQIKWIVGVVVLVVILALIGWWRQKMDKPTPVAVSDQQQQMPAADTTSPAPKPPVSAKTQAQLYTDAVKMYQYRLQFLQCHGTIPTALNNGTLVIKKGVKFMLDNRDATAHTFAFAGQSVRVGGYNFAIVSVPTAGLYPLTCDGGGAASLNVQG